MNTKQIIEDFLREEGYVEGGDRARARDDAEDLIQTFLRFCHKLDVRLQYDPKSSGSVHLGTRGVDMLLRIPGADPDHVHLHLEQPRHVRIDLALIQQMVEALEDQGSRATIEIDPRYYEEAIR